MGMITYRCPACFRKFEQSVDDIAPNQDVGGRPAWPREVPCACGAMAVRKRRGPLHKEQHKAEHPRARKPTGVKRER